MSAPAPDTVDSVCPNRLDLNSGLRIPYCSNRSLDRSDAAVRRAVVVIHGTKRNGPGYYQYVLDAANIAGTTDESIIIAPHFLTEDDVNDHNPGSDVPFWTNKGWKQGDLSTSTNPRSATLSSFEVADRIMARLADRNVFPNIQSIVLAGHSAGGQYVNRYASANHERVPTSYIAANPSSYLYMDKQRRIAGTVDQFTTPQAADCCEYNSYKHGLQALNSYMQAIGVNQIQTQYPLRRVVYLLGTADNDPDHDLLDKDCASKLQGDHRLERGTVFFNYLQHFYGPGILKQQKVVFVPGVGHSGKGMFTSTEGVQELFGPLPE